jgi:hypothetical protein
MGAVVATCDDYKKQLVEVDNLDEPLPDHSYWRPPEQVSCCQQSTSGEGISAQYNTTIH